MESNYLTSLPRQSIRIIDGFPGIGKQFWLPRASVLPSASLQTKIFPLVEEILPLIEDGYEDEQNSTDSTTGVECPTNPIFCNLVFCDPEFLEFEAGLLEHVLTAIFKKIDNIAGSINFTNARQATSATKEEAYSGHWKDMQNVIGSLNGLNFSFNEFRSACVNFGNNTTSAPIIMPTESGSID
ncbi:hypothetical protein PHYBLDRAFT_143967 [Phycomyces blakesleeanus NRRL 1555(-)]|uniref:Uncharacterized protein n=1 Tax=Phycomyces blakesleeanus (strain ATCC 8743b / DSM 1359 / FGSC 10004 / NBRC 33097 / NRRL 1555) TaxID=763407 RepID=A0A167ND67_PHYB8|nr:hypothetical protein PHYBLDRAFT_143967 [Phycomyces blakesleeanus NRRL 1555(-)]OAD75718.1 hypothetical protein PHYBLDRAFT_143967 [Phycomyces blakesleeanus NRRL 1555(-)]|eukprot:XP_018293758.1 hypothetical protein PHYBLDRAFT_143967 [Phycomyces blakesleeanus NRRL 1555(-)]